MKSHLPSGQLSPPPLPGKLSAYFLAELHKVEHHVFGMVLVVKVVGMERCQLV